jgi:hypothetical protein
MHSELITKSEENEEKMTCDLPADHRATALKSRLLPPVPPALLFLKAAALKSFASDRRGARTFLLLIGALTFARCSPVDAFQNNGAWPT